jgi:diphthamide biosynthesis protein 7
LEENGSYDCKLRVFDARNFREPLMSEDVGGGIWRIKWDESRVLLATMHAGFRVLSLTQEDSDESRADSDLPAVANAYPQKIRSLTLSKVSDNVQLAYGADWFPSGSRTLVAGCSFYDRALYFWNIPSA